VAADQLNQGLADPFRGKGRAKLLVDRAFGFENPFRNDAIASDYPDFGLGLVRGADRQLAARFLVGRQGAGPEHSVADQGSERRHDLSVEIVAPLRGVGGRLEIEVCLGRQLPGRPDVFAEIIETG
jgi:hypothetical protein